MSLYFLHASCALDWIMLNPFIPDVSMMGVETILNNLNLVFLFFHIHFVCRFVPLSHGIRMDLFFHTHTIYPFIRSHVICNMFRMGYDTFGRVWEANVDKNQNRVQHAACDKLQR